MKCPATRSAFAAIVSVICAVTAPAQGPRKISDDRDLKEIDLASWDCANKPEGSARTPDGQERNRLKNRAPTDIGNLKLPDLDVPGFIKSVGQFDSLTVHTRRKDIGAGERQQLDPMEKEIAQVTGYLGVAYCGPPETTNCASVDFHDWHLEVFEKPIDHPPQPGDTTPIICEITPRTQNGIFADKVRIQELTAFIRRADMTYEPTGHPARKIRIIGYRMWDDEHNGSADVGTTVKKMSPNGYHNPWRQTAWEIHPVIKIVPGGASLPSTGRSSAASPTPTAMPASSATASPAATAVQAPPPTAIPTVTPPPNPQFVTVTRAVAIQIPYGQTTLRPGTKLPFVSRDARTVTVQYMGEKYPIPISSTDLQ
jgi:hypothetical protein